MNEIEKILFASLIELSQWEQEELPDAHSLIGRHVYFCIAKEILLRNGNNLDQPLKQKFFHPVFTGRAIRHKLREFEAAGLINASIVDSDKRFRQLVPTQILIELIERHAKIMRQIFETRIYQIEKY